MADMVEEIKRCDEDDFIGKKAAPHVLFTVALTATHAAASAFRDLNANDDQHDLIGGPNADGDGKRYRSFDGGKDDKCDPQ